MLILDYMAYSAANGYIDFISTLSWFRMYCVGRFGESKKDYLDGFDSLKSHYDHLWWGDESERKNFLNNFSEDIESMFKKIEELLSVKRWGEKQVNEIAKLINAFLTKEENRFRKSYFDFMIKTTTKHDYAEDLFSAVKELLDDEHNDEAVLTSFKYLDSHLQKLLKLSPHENYGEDLINKAFAPNTGILQLHTNPNEQSGLRNLLSGANAVFRNPSAHKFMKFDDFDAAAVVAMVAVITKISIQIAENNQPKSAE